jgi:hypothetical protein
VLGTVAGKIFAFAEDVLSCFSPSESELELESSSESEFFLRPTLDVDSLDVEVDTGVNLGNKPCAFGADRAFIFSFDSESESDPELPLSAFTVPEALAKAPLSAFTENPDIRTLYLMLVPCCFSNGCLFLPPKNIEFVSLQESENILILPVRDLRT